MDTLSPVGKVVAYAGTLACFAWATWCTVIAFTGGKLPLLPWELKGGFIQGVLWMMFVDPIILTVAWWAFMVLLLPFMAGAARRQR